MSRWPVTYETATRRKYMPIDRVLEMPRVRILRALRHFDHISAPDLRDVMNIEVGSHDAWNFTNNLRLMARDGSVAIVGPSFYRLYQITQEGRRQLAALLDRGLFDHQGKRSA